MLDFTGRSGQAPRTPGRSDPHGGGVKDDMARHLVVATEKETWSLGGMHRHVTALGLADGRRVPRPQAILNLELGLATYLVDVAGQPAELEIVPRCARCGTAHLRTKRDADGREILLELPDPDPAG